MKASSSNDSSSSRPRRSRGAEQKKSIPLRRQWWILTGFAVLAMTLLAVDDLTTTLRVAEMFDEGEETNVDLLHLFATWIPWFLLAPAIAFLGLRFVPGRMPWWLALIAHIAAAVGSACFVQWCEPWLLSEFHDARLVEVSSIPFDESTVEGLPDLEGEVVFVSTAIWTFFSQYLVRFAIFDAVTVVPAIAWLSNERERRRSLIARELAETENRLLRAQLQPHFLFNALNGIQVLVDEDSELAKKLLRRLSGLLRNTLEDAHLTSLPLRRELEILDDYLEIERLRFGDRIEFSLDVDQGIDEVMVPAFLLQPLIENCLIHGPGNMPEGGVVRVRIARLKTALEVRIADNGPGVASEDEMRLGHGLGILQQRLSREYGDRATLSSKNLAEGGFEVRVLLPLH